MIFRVLVLGLAASSSLSAEINAYAAEAVGVVDAIDVATDVNLTPGGIAVGTDPYMLAVSPDGSRVYVAKGSSHTVTIIDTATNTPTTTIDLGVGTLNLFVAFSPDGSRAYTVNYRPTPMSSSVTVIDTATETIVMGTPVTVGIEAQMVAVTPDSAQAWIPNYNPTALTSDVSVIRTSDNTVIATIPVERRPIWLAIRPQGDKVYVANYFTGSVSALSTATLMNTAASPIAAGIGVSPQHIAITPDGSEAYVANLDSDTVSVIDTATDTVSHVIPVGDGPFFIAITPDGSRAYVANSGSDDVTVIDIASHTVIVPSIPTGMSPLQLAVAPDGSKVYVANTGSSFVTSIMNGAVPAFLTNIATTSSVNWIAFTPVLRQLLTLSGYQTLNRFLTQTDRVNVLLWTNPNNPEIVAYRIYRDAALTDLAGVVPANGPLRFEDHRRQKGVAVTYYLVSVDPVGDQEIQGMFTIAP